MVSPESDRFDLDPASFSRFSYSPYFLHTTYSHKMTGNDYRIGVRAITDHHAKTIDYEGHRRNIEALLDAIGS